MSAPPAQHPIVLPPRAGTGHAPIDVAMGGRWPPGSVIEIDADRYALAPLLAAGVTAVDNPDGGATVSTAGVMLAAGSTVAITLADAATSPPGASKAMLAKHEAAARRTTAILEAVGVLAAHAAAGGGVLLLVRTRDVTEDGVPTWMRDIAAAEARMTARTEARQPTATGPAVVARVVTGPAAMTQPMRWHVGYPAPPPEETEEGDDAGG